MRIYTSGSKIILDGENRDILTSIDKFNFESQMFENFGLYNIGEGIELEFINFLVIPNHVDETVVDDFVNNIEDIDYYSTSYSVC